MAVLAGAAVWFFLVRPGNHRAAVYLTAPVERGPIVSRVSSTGTVTPVTTVLVGSQVSGQIKEILVDFNSVVTAGQVIARIDPIQVETKVRQAEAELAMARANLALKEAALKKAGNEPRNSRADLTATSAQVAKSRAALNKAQKDLERYQNLLNRSIVSRADYDQVLATYQQAKAQLESDQAQVKSKDIQVDSSQATLKMAEAEVQQAQAQVLLKEAALNTSKVDLDHTVIRSPVDGVVISRDVDVGQTVAASLQAPTLFTIAQDLSRMQVEVNLDEADIGKIQSGQKVIFTVDAFPGQEYAGQVLQIRKSPQTLQNVVTYTVVVSADNQDASLLPGMTANVDIVVREHLEALTAPNAAFRFLPEDDAQTPSSQEGGAEGSSTGNRARAGAEILTRLAKALDLTPDQKSQVAAIVRQGFTRLKNLKTNGAGQDQIKQAQEEMQKQRRILIAALLTPEQKEKFGRLIVQRAASPNKPGTLYVPDPNGKPRAVEVVSGISDGLRTEIVRGNLKEGDPVILGIQRTPQNPSASPLRFGF